MPTLSNEDRLELIDLFHEKAQMAFQKEPNLCCTNSDVNTLAETGTGTGTLELVQCPQCDEKWVRKDA